MTSNTRSHSFTLWVGAGPMNNSELKYPQWQFPCREAILEFDRNRLPGKIRKAEAAVRERLQVLEQRANGQEERQALSDAISTLTILKR
jgi:hypothetical protein